MAASSAMVTEAMAAVRRVTVWHLLLADPTGYSMQSLVNPSPLKALRDAANHVRSAWSENVFGGDDGDEDDGDGEGKKKKKTEKGGGGAF